MEAWTWKIGEDNNGNPVIVYCLNGVRKLTTYFEDMLSNEQNPMTTIETVAQQTCLILNCRD
jgi:protein tyrosine phosphatase (PTP) superfamily phosphohydrolase (DUF442 family)